jgi:hypothetical protein
MADDQPASSVNGIFDTHTQVGEGLRRGHNADIGRKDFFEMASNKKPLDAVTRGWRRSGYYRFFKPNGIKIIPQKDMSRDLGIILIFISLLAN